MHNLLLLTVICIRISGIVTDAISACSGESVKLVNIISFTPNYSVVSLYVKDSNYDLIGMWFKGKLVINSTHCSLDDNGTVWIHNVTLSDERKYKVVHAINGTRELWNAQLTVWVAPTNSCRPHVTRDGNTLIASLQVGTDCGKPEAVPYLLEDPNITHSSKFKSTLTSGREAGTYCACIETPALSCARSYNRTDLCSSITVNESRSQTSLPAPILIVFAVLVCIGLSMTAFYFILRRKCDCSCYCHEPFGKRRLSSKEESHPMTNVDNMVPLIHTNEFSAIPVREFVEVNTWYHADFWDNFEKRKQKLQMN